MIIPIIFLDLICNFCVEKSLVAIGEIVQIETNKKFTTNYR